jgi:hypothetical protein
MTHIKQVQPVHQVCHEVGGHMVGGQVEVRGSCEPSEGLSQMQLSQQKAHSSENKGDSLPQVSHL